MIVTQAMDAAWKRADDLLKELTLQEKIDYIGGDGYRIRSVARLGIPEIVMSDGPMGCGCYGQTAALPGGIALAATWNPELAYEVGVALGRECRAWGVHILLAPGVNIYRSPLCGRNFEYMGEDPLLASIMAASEIEGLQSQQVLATVKHFACNNQEWDRHNISSEVDERVLQEIYFPAFKTAVQKAKARCVMTGYNLVNGVHCTQNDYLLDEVLRQEWGFDGIIISDWDSTYDGVAAANAGLDLEMPTGKMMNRETLEPAIRAGLVKESTIDEKVRRILRTITAAGFLDRPQMDPSIPKDDPHNDRVALKGALESIVVLKNDCKALPLDRQQVKSVAVLGPNAHSAVYGGGGSSYVHPYHSTSIAEGLRETAGEVELRFPTDYLDLDAPAKMEFFGNLELEGAPLHTSQTPDICFRWETAPVEELAGTREFSVRFTGRIRSPRSGNYTFTTCMDGGTRVFVDDKLIVDAWHDSGYSKAEANAHLTAGEHDLTVEYRRGYDANVSFGWRPCLSGSEIAASVQGAEAVVCCVGFNRYSEIEGCDRPYELLADQVEMIRALAEANSRLIVVLNSGGGVAWDGWLDKAQAVVQAWYPGQEVGRAVAEILFGDANPSGKLPATFEKRLADNPTSPYYHINDQGKTPYTEGIFVGYRGYDKAGKEPQFPFGHGLSYTTFEFGSLAVSEKRSGASKSFEVTCNVTNTGDRSGAEVVQLYLGQSRCSVCQPVRELKGFSKVFLQPNETRQVEFVITEEVLAFYDVKAHRWVTEPGEFGLWIGRSSRDLPLHAVIRVARS